MCFGARHPVSDTVHTGQEKRHRSQVVGRARAVEAHLGPKQALLRKNLVSCSARLQLLTQTVQLQKS